MELSKAKILSASLADYMRPFCDRIEVAGSIRRECREVKDVEIVCVPRWTIPPAEDQPGSLFPDFGAVPELRNMLHAAVSNQPDSDIRLEWIKPGVSEIVPWHVKPDGKYWRGLVAGADDEGALQPIKLDLFLCRKDNWGVIYTIRTGSADFSRALVTYARDKTDYRVDGGELKYKGAVVPCPDEHTLFESLNLKWMEPRMRHSGVRDLVAQDF